MKRVNAILGASGLVLALSLPSWAQEVRQLPTQTLPFRAPWQPSIIPSGW
jgi:hypothetical protein